MMKQILLPVAALLSMVVHTAKADYAMPPLESIIQSASISIVDATVTEITTKGYAKIHINSQIKGKTTTSILKGFSLSCTGPTVQQGGVKKGKRYIFVIEGANIYEGSTYWEILKSFDGELFCNFKGHGTSYGNKGPAIRIPQSGIYKLDVIKSELRNVANQNGQ